MLSKEYKYTLCPRNLVVFAIAGGILATPWISLLTTARAVAAEIGPPFIYGTDSNPCIQDARGALDRLDGGKRDAHILDYEPLTPFKRKSHAQGVARLSGIGKENWFAISRAAESGLQILEFVEFDQIESDGGPLAEAKVRTNDRGINRMSFDPVEHNNNHAGGIQAVGRFLFVGSDGSSGNRVDVYDVSELPTGSEPSPVNSLVLGERGEPGAFSAHWVGATRLHSGRYMMVVGRDERDLAGTNKDHQAWFYVSRGTNLTNTGWDYVGFWDYAGIRERKAYQSVNAVQQCDGTTFLVMMRPGRAKKNYLDLWRLDGIESDSFSIPVKEVTRRIFKRRRKGRCTFNAGGGVHIAPDGSDFVVYCTEKADRFNMQIDEYRDKSNDWANPIECGGRTATIVATGPSGRIIGTDEDDVVVGTSGADRIEGLGGHDTICGLDGDDLLLGGAGDDELIGGDGNDRLRGGDGGDRLEGGAGRDFIEDIGRGADQAIGGDGYDIGFLWGQSQENFEVNLVDEMYSGSGGTGGSFVGFEVAGNGPGNDRIIGSGGDDFLYGGSGDDELIGGEGNDRLRGGDGGDQLEGGAGRDFIEDIGRGADQAIGGDGYDIGFLWGQSQENFEVNLVDEMYSGSGGTGGSFVGFEVAGNGPGNDRIIGTGGDDFLYGGSGDDELIGGEGNDRLRGGDGTDYCFDDPAPATHYEDCEFFEWFQYFGLVPYKN